MLKNNQKSKSEDFSTKYSSATSFNCQNVNEFQNNLGWGLQKSKFTSDCIFNLDKTYYLT